VDEIDIGKLATVLEAKYGSINEAQKLLGSVQDIQKTFIDFQKYLYQEAV
jgi:type I restriction enzyme R subunit